MTPERLTEIGALANAATPGPWRSTWPDELNFDDAVVAVGPDGLTRSSVVGVVWHDGHHPACTESDSAFIAAARTAVPQLIAALRERDATIAAKDAEMHKMRSALVDVSEYPHDQHNHKHPTQCRACMAKAIVTGSL